jgi:hypothetical protein
MKYVVLLLLVGLASPISQAADWLDTPIVIPAGTKSSDVLAKLADSLPEEDRFFFEQAYTALRIEFVVNKAYSGISIQDREAILTAHVSGMTARKIIVSGMTLRAVQYNQRDEWEPLLKTEEERKDRREHMKKDGEDAYRLSLEALKRYKTEANQPVQPTPGTGSVSNFESPARRG